ncbi:MAG TPA: glycosyl hydrolase family 28-related protein [Vicinamibacteria bacterium]|nr:glycosyl hydrolase family 28-related protein [Vicinamibacteria bacterium]
MSPRRHRSALWPFFFVLCSTVHPQVAADIVPPGRRTTWNPGIPGGIPARSTVCASLSASTWGNGSLDATAALQAAIDACPVGQVVLLSAGTFRVASGPLLIDKGIVLRGAGSTATLLQAPDGTGEAVVILGRRWPQEDGSTNLTTNAAKGSSSVTVANASGLAGGEVVLVDKLTDASITRWSAESPPGDPSRGWFSRMDRPLAQVMEIASVSGNTVSLTTPFHIDFDVAHSAQLTRFREWVGGPLLPAVKYAGLEDLRVYGGEGHDGGGNVRLELAAYTWVKDVQSEYSAGGSIALFRCFRCVVRDSYLHHTKDPNPGGNGYGLSINRATADSLFENNIVWNFNKVIVMRATGGGNVIGYNYFEDGYGAGYPNWVETGLQASHMTTPHYELFEGNQAFNLEGDATWGNSVFITFFRNHATSTRRSLGGLNLLDLGNRRAIGLAAGHYWYTFVGNVLGYSGMTPQPAGTAFIYQNTYPWDDDPVPMWKLGYPDSQGTPGVTVDPQVAATAIRDGSFDYATNQVHWDNPPQAIPDSLYLTRKPAFFGSRTWPWVNSTGIPKLHALPARARFDSGTPSPGSDTIFGDGFQ